MHTSLLSALSLATILLSACGDDGEQGEHDDPPFIVGSGTVDSGTVNSGTSPGSTVLVSGSDSGSELVVGNGMRVSEERNLSGFVRVSVDGVLDTQVTQGATFGVRVNIDSNLLSLVKTEVKGDTLHISEESPTGFQTKQPGPHIEVTLPQLRELRLTGTTDVKVSSVEPEPLDLALSGTGSIAFDGSTPQLRVDLDGTGTVSLAGSAAEIEFTLDGTGKIDATSLSARRAKVDLSGTGSVQASVTESVSATCGGTGSVDIHGGATVSASESEPTCRVDQR